MLKSSLLTAVSLFSFLGCHSRSGMDGNNQGKKTVAQSVPSDDLQNHASEPDRMTGSAELLEIPSETALNDWCQNAALTTAMRTTLKSLFANFCENGTSTDLFRNILKKDYYAGSGELPFIDVIPMKSDPNKKTTTYLTAVGLKISKSLGEHFKKIVPDTPDDISKNVLSKLNGSPDELVIIEKIANQSPFYITGWKFRTTKNYRNEFPNASISSENRIDMHKLLDGEQYLYSQFVEQSIENVNKFNLITAGVRGNQDSFLITLIEFETDNKGYSAIAESRTKNTIEQAVLGMYNF